MTTEQFTTIITSAGYAGLFFGVLLSLLLNIFFLYDDGMFLIYSGRNNEGWLYLLIIPVEFMVAVTFFIKLIPHLF